MRTKALVLDIDGTLTNSRKEITSATKAALQEILERGHKVVLASGRPTFGMGRYVRELELDKYGGYILSHNGARILDCRTGEVIFQKAVPPEILPGIYEFALKNHCGLATHSDDTVISAFKPDRYVAWEAHINEMPVRQVEHFTEYVNFPVYKCFMTADGERAAALEKQLQGLFDQSVSVYRSESYFIEIVPRDVDKGDSLGRLMAAVGMEKGDVVCCGDGYNDISMIRYAGVGVAMGNAVEALKEAADYIAGSNDEDGLVQVIRNFLQTA